MWKGKKKIENKTENWLSSYNPSREFRLCSDLETALIETPKFSSTVLSRVFQKIK